MSLLMDALKQAEKANDEKDPKPGGAASESSVPDSLELEGASGLDLELPEPEPLIDECLETQETGTDTHAQWIADTFSSSETADTGNAEEIAIPEKPVVGTESDLPGTLPQGNIVRKQKASFETSSQVADRQEAVTTAGHRPADAAAHVLSASRAYKRRRRTSLALTFAGILCGVTCTITAYWYWAQSRNAPKQPLPFTATVVNEMVEPNAAEARVPAPAITDTAATPADSPGNESGSQEWQPAPVDPQTLQVRVDQPQTDQQMSQPSETTLRFTRTQARSSVQPALKSAYAAFRKNQYFKARDLYQQALQREPRNRNALLGLAAVAVKNDDFDVAAGYYHRLLELNPKDSAAHAGLSTLRGSRDPVAAESQIKLLLNTQPDLAHLHFALGNVYSEQARWPEAQEAYFDAVRLDSENPDYTFNLAISLDRMSKHSTALKYYRTALALGATRSASFDAGAVRGRIQLLESTDSGQATATP